MLKERGKDDLSFVLPIADFKIDQHFRELFLFSSSMVLKYNVFIFFLFNLLNKLLKVLYFLIFSSVGLCILRENNFPLFIEEFSNPVVNQGYLFVNLALDETSRNGNYASNSAKYISIKFV